MLDGVLIDAGDSWASDLEADGVEGGLEAGGVGGGLSGQTTRTEGMELELPMLVDIVSCERQ